MYLGVALVAWTCHRPDPDDGSGGAVLRMLVRLHSGLQKGQNLSINILIAVRLTSVGRVSANSPQRVTSIC